MTPKGFDCASVVEVLPNPIDLDLPLVKFVVFGYTHNIKAILKYSTIVIEIMLQ